MRLTADTEALEKSLDDAIATIERKLKHTAKGFAYEFSVVAVANTPLGEEQKNADSKYYNLYQNRVDDSDWQSYGLEPKEGFARGAWQVSFDGSLTPQENYGVGSGKIALQTLDNTLKGYKLGQTITIGNYGPYIQDLEKGYSEKAPDGISKPTISQVLQAYLINVKKYYEAG